MTLAKKTKKYVRVKRYRDHQIVGETKLDLATIKPRQTFGIRIFGFVMSIGAGITGFVLGTFLAIVLLALFTRIFLPFYRNRDIWVVIALLVGIGCSLVASPLLRRSGYFLKRRYLRNAGTEVKATVVGYKRMSSPKGPEEFDLLVIWQHPVSGQTFTHERHYSFFWELLSPKKDDLFKSYYAGANLLVRFNPKKPQQFMLDIPFVPCWFDVLF